MKTDFILFDLDGTLSNPFEGVAKGIQLALTETTGKTPEWESLKACIGPPLHVSFARLLGEEIGSAKVEESLEIYRKYYREQGLIENFLYEGVEELLESLEGKMPLFVATSKPQPFAEHVLEHFGIAKYFRNVYGSHFDGSKTDKVELIGDLLNKEKPQGNGMMVGDRLYDMQGGKGNGLLTCGALWGFGTKEELLESGADVLAETPLQILDLL